MPQNARVRENERALAEARSQEEGVQRAESEVRCKESHTRIPGPMKWRIR